VRFLFNISPASGHVFGPIEVARALLTNGHEVAFVCVEDREFARDRLRYAEVPAHSLEVPYSPPGKRSHEKKRSHGVELAKLYRDPAIRRAYRLNAYVHIAKQQLPAIRHAIKEYKPDVVITDPTCLAGALAAELDRVPWVGESATWVPMIPPEELPALLADWEMPHAARAKLLDQLGVSLCCRLSEAYSPRLNFVFSVEDLTPMHAEVPARNVLVGPVRRKARESEVPFPWDKLDPRRPLVYVSPGTMVEFDTQVTEAIVRTALDLGAQVVFVKADATVDPREHVIFVTFAPQLALLQRASVYVAHGGCSSLIEGLLAGVPLLVLPITFEQPMNALFVERGGFGRVIDPWSWDQERFAQALGALIRENAPERARVRAFREATQNADGPVRAAELLAQL